VSSCIVTSPSAQISGGQVIINLFAGLFTGGAVISIDAYLAQSKFAGFVSPGLRYWDPAQKAWTSNYPPTASHPILLLHGLLSSVEDTYSNTMVQQLRANGGYDVVLGYDYNWLDTTQNIASQIAGSVSGYSHLDIMGHSYGTLVAMDLIPDLPSTDVQNLLLMEGPLDGAMTDQGSYVLSMLLAQMPSSLQNIVLPTGLFVMGGPWYQQFVPNSAALNAIHARYAAATNLPTRVIKIGGVGSLPNEAALYQTITGSALPSTPNDGIILTSSETTGSVLGSGKTRNGVASANYSYAFPDATHTDPASHLHLINNYDDEGYLQQGLHFQINNSSEFDGVYYNQPAVFIKGANTYTPLSVFGNAQYTWSFTGLTTPFRASATSAPEAADQFSITAANIINFTLASASGLVAIGSTPTDELQLINTSPPPNPRTSTVGPFDMWALPDCTFCSAASLGTKNNQTMMRSMLSSEPAAITAMHVAFKKQRTTSRPIFGTIQSIPHHQ
jgi:pimeloyl-ACP methyl ester carboxylesterase